MPLKSLLQRLLGIPAREVPSASTARLEGRSDWKGTPLEMARLIDPNFPNPPAWTQPKGHPLAGYRPDKWPATDDPYAAPGPCDIVPDPALETISTITGYADRTNANTRRLADRGLTCPLDSVKSVTDLLHLIERQEAAELHLTKLGMTWTRERGWHLPDPYLA